MAMKQTNNDVKADRGLPAAARRSSSAPGSSHPVKDTHNRDMINSKPLVCVSLDLNVCVPKCVFVNICVFGEQERNEVCVCVCVCVCLLYLIVVY